MLETRYRDKKNLSKYDLSVGLFNNFDLIVKDVVPIRDVFIISTDRGEKVLKKVDYSIEDLEFIHDSIQLIKNKFDRVLDFTKAKDGKVYTRWKKDIYCVMDLVPGRECDFSNPIDVSIASKGLGEFHRATEDNYLLSSKKDMVGKLVDTFKRKYHELELFKSIAEMHECKTEFDTIFLKKYDYNINNMKASIKLLEASCYKELCKEKDKIALCHHDLAYHNILINEELAYFIDFDFAIIDLKVHDLCNFISKAIKNFAYDIEKAEAIIKDYNNSNSLDERELTVLYAMLTFPENFYSISKDYYTRRKDWEEEVFLDRLIKKVFNDEDKEEFLEDFSKRIL